MNNYNQMPQGSVAPMPQQVQGQQFQQVQPMQQPVQAQQPTGQPQGVNFPGGVISPQDGQVINQLCLAINNALGVQLNDRATVFKSLYFGFRDFFKTLYVNQISQERGSKPTTPDYEKAQQVFENVFGTVGQPKVTEAQLCLTMKAIAPDLLPNLTSSNKPHEAIMSHILTQNWHSQNVRQNSGGTRNTSISNGSGSNNNVNPFGNAQSKAAAAAGIVNGQVPAQPVNYTPNQPMQPTGYAPNNGNPQQAAQAVMGAMPTY